MIAPQVDDLSTPRRTNYRITRTLEIQLPKCCRTYKKNEKPKLPRIHMLEPSKTWKLQRGIIVFLAGELIIFCQDKISGYTTWR